MNQILATQNIKDKKKGYNNKAPANINNVIKFFAIVLIIFGIFMIASSSYAIYKSGIKGEISTTKPEIQVEEKNGSEDELLITIMHDKTISKAVYYWEDEAEEEIDGGKTYIQKVITIPSGEKTLHIIATDVNGQKSEFQRIYTLGDEQTPNNENNKIKSDIKINGTNIKIELEGKVELSYMTYKWDDGEETKIDINNIKYETELEVEIGEHELTIYVVDVDGNKLNETKKVLGTTKPKITLEKGDECYVIKASDDTSLEKIVVKRLDDNKEFKFDVEDKEFQYNFPLIQGENRIDITAYNVNGATETVRARWVKK